jgi:hypothetical protein
MRKKVFLTDAFQSDKEAAVIVFLKPENMEYITRQVITVFGVLTK